MTLEMRRKLAQEPFEEKIRKVGQLIQLAKSFPKKSDSKGKLISARGETLLNENQRNLDMSKVESPCSQI